jgi:AcrR family transcriptional regulator
MRKVAARVGVSATAIYRHYRDKEALMSEVVVEGHRLLMSRFKRALAASTARGRR